MKKNILFSLGFLVIFFTSHAQVAKVHLVNVANFSFSPKTISDVIVGDTVRWVWVSGSHTTTCDPASQGTGNSLPAGAATWNADINSTSTTFDYVVKVAGDYNYWCIPHAPNMAGSFTASNALPVTLTSFQVNGSNANVSLNWRTATEQNTDYFSIRRSSNGSEFTEIARVPAAGNSAGETSYAFTDTKISSGQEYYYYNLAIVDKDGKRVFSDTKLFKNKLSNLKLITSISPNPVTAMGHLMMTFNAEKEGKMNVKVISTEGKILINTMMQAYAGVNNGHLHLGDLPAGTYSIVFMLNGLKETHQVVVK
jgi:plastocyanin